MTTEHTVLVAFTVESDGPRTAQSAVMHALHGVLKPQTITSGQVTSWWIAEDERIDGSDCDSAVFVPPGTQAIASEILSHVDLTT